MKVKVALVGSSACGKTYVANILSSEGTGPEAKPPYRPTHSVRIVEFTLHSLPISNTKYNTDADVQMWEVGGNPGLKSIWPGVQSGLDGVIIMYDVGKETSIREASALYMNWVTHNPSNVSPNQALVLGNKFRGSAEQGPQRIAGVPPRAQHIAINIEDDPGRLKEEIKMFVTRIAQQTMTMDRENKAKLMM